MPMQRSKSRAAGTTRTIALRHGESTRSSSCVGRWSMLQSSLKNSSPLQGLRVTLRDGQQGPRPWQLLARLFKQALQRCMADPLFSVAGDPEAEIAHHRMPF